MSHNIRKRAKGVIAVAIGCAVLALTGCETGPVRPLYVSPTNYQSMNCNQLNAEYIRIDTYLRNGVEVPKSIWSGFNFGLGAFGGGRYGWGWSPSVSYIAGQSSSSPRTVYAQLLGQRDAIAQQATFKGCPIILRPPTPPAS